MELNPKEEYLKSLDEFIETTESQLDNILQEIGWNKEYVSQKVNERHKDGEKFVTCNIDANHRIPQKALDRHQEICSWVSEGYTAEDMKKVPPSSQFFYENNSLVTTVLIDEKLQNDILRQNRLKGEASYSSAFTSENFKKLPRTMDRAVTELSVSERLAIYDYVAVQSQNNSKIPLEELQMASNENLNSTPKVKSRLEVLAEERDYKRRRQSYRAKNVHITKKSYTEILRDVIQSHTDALKTQEIEDDIESEVAVQTQESPKKTKVYEKGHRKRSRSISKESYHRESKDHREKRRRSHSKDSDNCSRHSHKEKRHKHKSKKKSHKHDRHRHRNSVQPDVF